MQDGGGVRCKEGERGEGEGCKEGGRGCKEGGRGVQGGRRGARRRDARRKGARREWAELSTYGNFAKRGNHTCVVKPHMEGGELSLPTHSFAASAHDRPGREGLAARLFTRTD